jgi:hypothetical protein
MSQQSLPRPCCASCVLHRPTNRPSLRSEGTSRSAWRTSRIFSRAVKTHIFRQRLLCVPHTASVPRLKSAADSLLRHGACRRHHARGVAQQRVHVAAAATVHETVLHSEPSVRVAVPVDRTHLRKELLTLMLRSQSRFETRAESACSSGMPRHDNRTTAQQLAHTSSRAFVVDAMRRTVVSLLAMAGPASRTN